MKGDRYAESEHIREHPAYREGYDRGYRQSIIEDEIKPVERKPRARRRKKGERQSKRSMNRAAL